MTYMLGNDYEITPVYGDQIKPVPPRLLIAPMHLFFTDPATNIWSEDRICKAMRWSDVNYSRTANAPTSLVLYSTSMDLDRYMLESLDTAWSRWVNRHTVEKPNFSWSILHDNVGLRTDFNLEFPPSSFVDARFYSAEFFREEGLKGNLDAAWKEVLAHCFNSTIEAYSFDHWRPATTLAEHFHRGDVRANGNPPIKEVYMLGPGYDLRARAFKIPQM